MRPVDRFIAFFLTALAPSTRWQRYHFGIGLLSRTVRKVKMRIQTRGLPTGGFKKELWSHQQNGEMYRHLYFHLACMLFPGGSLISWAAALTDKRQVSKGRKESETEVLDNLAGRACGRILRKFHLKKISHDVCRSKMLKILS